jgi:hypothetical protein
MFKRTSRSDPKSADQGAKPEKSAKPAKQPKAPKPAKAAKSVKPAEPQIYRKPRADIYTVMLSVALIAVALAATALWMTMNEYNKMINGGPNPSWNSPPAPAAFDPPRAVV